LHLSTKYWSSEIVFPVTLFQVFHFSSTQHNIVIVNITSRKPKVGGNILDNNDDYVPSICETPLYTSDEEFKAEVRNSALFKLQL
jgi:hypothetical protein